MSGPAIAKSPVADLVESFRGKRLTKNQVIAALVAAGATAGGAALLVGAVESSSGTPTPVAAPGAHNVAGIPAGNAAALHARHLGLQAGQ
jgi:hypothetical protein